VKPPSETRLSDVVSVGLLTRVFPPELVDEVIAEAGRREQRHRLNYQLVGMRVWTRASGLTPKRLS
jgi:serine/threonine protein kinase HipA of HipAB toxin-antitoxin module